MRYFDAAIIVPAEDAIMISKNFPIDMGWDVVKVFREKREKGEFSTKDPAVLIMGELINAVWVSGYISGVRTERAKKKPYTATPDQRNAV